MTITTVPLIHKSCHFIVEISWGDQAPFSLGQPQAGCSWSTTISMSKTEACLAGWLVVPGLACWPCWAEVLHPAARRPLLPVEGAWCSWLALALSRGPRSGTEELLPSWWLFPDGCSDPHRCCESTSPSPAPGSLSGRLTGLASLTAFLTAGLLSCPSEFYSLLTAAQSGD